MRHSKRSAGKKDKKKKKKEGKNVFFRSNVWDER